MLSGHTKQCSGHNRSVLRIPPSELGSLSEGPRLTPGCACRRLLLDLEAFEDETRCAVCLGALLPDSPYTLHRGAGRGEGSGDLRFRTSGAW